jgi:sulfate transport system substrate-binding protein
VTALLLAASVILASCADASGDSDSKKENVSIVGFSVMQTANKKVVADYKKTDEGQDVTFKESYGASGDQARSIIAGLKADEAHLSLEPDVSKLVDAGVVADSWKDNANKGILTQSVVVFVVRKGNPKNLKTWADLAKPGVEIVSPNPGSSGSAKWNILAAWGSAALGADDDDASATAFITKLLKNIVAFPGSGHDAADDRRRLRRLERGEQEVLRREGRHHHQAPREVREELTWSPRRVRPGSGLVAPGGPPLPTSCRRGPPSPSGSRRSGSACSS